MELVGYLGSFLFAACAIPEVYVSYKRGYSTLNPYFLGMWFSGEVLTLIYVWPTAMLPLILNYTFNLVCLIYIIHARLKFNRMLGKMMEKDSELILALEANDSLSKLPVIRFEDFQYNGTIEFPDYGTYNFKGKVVFVEPKIKYTSFMLEEAVLKG